MPRKLPEDRAEWQAEYYEKNREEALEYAARDRAENPDKVKEIKKKSRVVNREKANERARKYYAANKERLAEYYAARYAADRASPVGKAKKLIVNARNRSKEKNLPFDLGGYEREITEILANGACHYSGIPFNLGNNRREYDSPSLDQVDAGAGYTWNNVRVVCWALNAAKQDWPLPVLLEIMRQFVAYQDSKQASLIEQDDNRQGELDV